IGHRQGAAGKANFLLAHCGVEEIAWHLPHSAPQVDLEGERVLARPRLEYPLQRRVGNAAAIPIVLAVDLGNREPGWKGSASHHMLRADVIGRVVETDEISGPYIGRTDAKAHAAGVDPVKIH